MSGFFEKNPNDAVNRSGFFEKNPNDAVNRSGFFEKNPNDHSNDHSKDHLKESKGTQFDEGSVAKYRQMDASNVRMHLRRLRDKNKISREALDTINDVLMDVLRRLIQTAKEIAVYGEIQGLTVNELDTALHATFPPHLVNDIVSSGQDETKDSMFSSYRVKSLVREIAQIDHLDPNVSMFIATILELLSSRILRNSITNLNGSDRVLTKNQVILGMYTDPDIRHITSNWLLQQIEQLTFD